MSLTLKQEDMELLQKLEEDLWREETRFDIPYMETLLADDFIEFGRSGRIYSRDQTLSIQKQPIDAVIPLPDFKASLITENVALVTYNSEVKCNGTLLKGRRSSIWTRAENGWVIRFHQGTPYENTA